MTEPSAGLEQEETEHDVDLIHECVVKMAKEISDFMDITPDKQRMDSLMVAANIRNLSLLELFYTCVANLCKIMDERGTKIPDEQYHYIKKDDYNKCIYHKRDMDATERNVVVMKDADILIKICDSTGDFDDTSEYQLLIRLLKEPFLGQMFALNNYAGVSRKQPESTFAGVLQLDAYSRGMGGMGIPGDLSSQSRFVKVAFTKLNSISGEEEGESVSQFFHILRSVDQQRGCCEVTEGKYEITIYTSCCNTAKGIYYYTTYDNHQITAVDMHAENLDSDQLICYPLLSKGEVRWQNK